jgi:glucose-1-phosphate cytidylyltransferase
VGLSSLKVVILCGGLGTRIRGVDDDVPKPMIRIGGEPILVHIMRYYASWGHRDFILCLGYKGDVIRSYFTDRGSVVRRDGDDLVVNVDIDDTGRSDRTWTVTLAETGTATMTGGRVAKVHKHVDGESFMLTYGDGVTDVNIDELIASHERRDRAMTLTAVRPPSRFGEVRYGADGVATSFNEKPQTSEGRISGGYFVCRPKVFDYLADREDLVFEVEPMKGMVRDGQLSVYEHDGFWQCMDTHRDWELLGDLDRRNEAPWKR